MVEHHRHGALPEGDPHLRGGVNPRKDGEQTIREHGVKEEDARTDDDDAEEHAPVAQDAIARQDDGDHEARAARVGHAEAREREDEDREREAAPPAREADRQPECQADDDVKVAREDVRIFPCREDTLRQLGERCTVHPFHRGDVDAEDELIKAVEDDEYRRRRHGNDDGAQLLCAPQGLPREQIGERIDRHEMGVVVKAERHVGRDGDRQEGDHDKEERGGIVRQTPQVKVRIDAQAHAKRRTADEEHRHRRERHERNQKRLCDERILHRARHTFAPARAAQRAPPLTEVVLFLSHEVTSPQGAWRGCRPRDRASPPQRAAHPPHVRAREPLRAPPQDRLPHV